jgi:hypothetical protein
LPSTLPKRICPVNKSMMTSILTAKGPVVPSASGTPVRVSVMVPATNPRSCWPLAYMGIADIKPAGPNMQNVPVGHNRGGHHGGGHGNSGQDAGNNVLERRIRRVRRQAIAEFLRARRTAKLPEFTWNEIKTSLEQGGRELSDNEIRYLDENLERFVLEGVIARGIVHIGGRVEQGFAINMEHKYFK